LVPAHYPADSAACRSLISERPPVDILPILGLHDGTRDSPQCRICRRLPRILTGVAAIVIGAIIAGSAVSGAVCPIRFAANGQNFAVQMLTDFARH
jgi:hypothetical protein